MRPARRERVLKGCRCVGAALRLEEVVAQEAGQGDAAEAAAELPEKLTPSAAAEILCFMILIL